MREVQVCVKWIWGTRDKDNTAKMISKRYNG